ISGSLQLGAAHRVLAALALPPLCAIVAAAWIAHRRLLRASGAALVSFLGAALVITRPAHLGLAGLAFAAASVAASGCFSGDTASRATWLYFVPLNKPPIMTLLLLPC